MDANNVKLQRVTMHDNEDKKQDEEEILMKTEEVKHEEEEEEDDEETVEPVDLDDEQAVEIDTTSVEIPNIEVVAPAEVTPVKVTPMPPPQVRNLFSGILEGQTQEVVDVLVRGTSRHGSRDIVKSDFAASNRRCSKDRDQHDDNQHSSDNDDDRQNDQNSDGTAGNSSHDLAHDDRVLVERIVSHGHTTDWYDQHFTEFCAVLSGEAHITFDIDIDPDGDNEEHETVSNNDDVGKVDDQYKEIENHKDENGEKTIVNKRDDDASKTETDDEPKVDDRLTVKLGMGDYVVIPAHVRHRVSWTSSQKPTVWIAVKWCN